MLNKQSTVPRPLETLKGFHLIATGSKAKDRVFLMNLSRCAATLKRIEMTGWNDIEDVRQIVECAPWLSWLDVGRKLGGIGGTSRNSGNGGYETKGAASIATPQVTNVTEWAGLLSTLPDLAAFHGVRFLYELSSQALAGLGEGGSGVGASSSSGILVAERSRLRKNDETAGMLAWKCAKLRRVDHWESDAGRIIVLLRDGERGESQARWEVRTEDTDNIMLSIL
ncbi:hypothetical protein AX17_002982 [Amanita inopinata Kibby_2008]|nr:hypothetical protein AX17_002982 [Amanita inopinata Kibby_2008]